MSYLTHFLFGVIFLVTMPTSVLGEVLNVNVPLFTLPNFYFHIWNTFYGDSLNKCQ